jgi:hypothetical protein
MSTRKASVMQEYYSIEEEELLGNMAHAHAHAHARAFWCPVTLDDWEDRVAEKCRSEKKLLGMIQLIDMECQSGRLSEAHGIDLLKKIEAEGEGAVMKRILRR